MGARALERPLLLGHRHLFCWPVGTHAPRAGAQSLLEVQPTGRGSPGRMEEAGLLRPSGGAAVPLRLRGWGPWDRTGRQGGCRAHCILAGSVSGSPSSQKPGREETGGALGTRQDPRWPGLPPPPGSHLGSPGRWVARWLRVPSIQQDGPPGPRGPREPHPVRPGRRAPSETPGKGPPGAGA